MSALVDRAASKKNSTQNHMLVHIPSFVRTITGDGHWQNEMDIIDARVLAMFDGFGRRSGQLFGVTVI